MIANVDWEATRKLHGASRVYLDGRERLGVADWKKRKKELAERSQGYCEYKPNGMTRCFAAAVDPHHIIPRSKERDDRLSNLLHVCRECHRALDPRQTRFGESSQSVRYCGRCC